MLTYNKKMSLESEVVSDVIQGQNVISDLIIVDNAVIDVLELQDLSVDDLTTNNITVSQECKFDELNIHFDQNLGGPTNNVFLGAAVPVPAAPATLTGILNVCVGSASGSSLTSGSGNVFIGDSAGQNVTTSVHNIAIGKNAVSGSTQVNPVGFDNVCVGSGCGSTKIESNNVAIGTNAMKQGGSFNIVLGNTAAGQGEVIGDRNIVIGTRACNNVTVGDTNILLGYQAQTTAGAPMALPRNRFALGTNCVASQDDTIYIGNQLVAPLYTNIVLGLAAGAGAASTLIPGPYLDDADASMNGVVLGQLYFKEVINTPPDKQSILCICLL